MELYGIERQAPVFFQDLVDSTNPRIKQLAAQGAPDGTLYIAAAQSAGRGRKGRAFLSPPGGLYLSMLLRPGCPAEEALSITPSAAVAVCRAVKAVCGLDCGIKWPNDVVLGGKQLCGRCSFRLLRMMKSLPAPFIFQNCKQITSGIKM